MASKSNKTVTLSTSGTTFADVIDVARHGAQVELSSGAIDAMAQSELVRETLGEHATSDGNAPASQQVQLHYDDDDYTAHHISFLSQNTRLLNHA